MKNNPRFWSNLIVGLPMLLVLFAVNYLPVSVPTHFSNVGHPDQFIDRTAWLESMVNKFILLVVIRTFLLVVLTKQTSLSDHDFLKVQFLSAVFVTVITVLFILDGLLSSPISTNYLPILVVFLSATSLHLLIPNSEIVIREHAAETVCSKQQIALQLVQALSKLIAVRVNILAGIVMLFARSSDRWTIGIVANLLALASISLLTCVRLRVLNR